MNDLLQQGVAALKAGDRPLARRLIGRAIQENPHSEAAWLWLSGAVESDDERLMCLNKVLAINPDNGQARQGIAALERKRPSRPDRVYPRPAEVRERPATPAPPVTPLPASHVPESIDHSQTVSQLPPEKRQALRGYAKLVTHELVQGKSRRQVVERLSRRGFPRRAVEQLVDEVAGVGMATRHTRWRPALEGALEASSARLILGSALVLGAVGGLLLFKGSILATAAGAAVGVVAAAAGVWLLGRLAGGSDDGGD